MQQYIIHLNGGYDPFVHLGRGALGYRPLRKMIGRGGDDEQGGGGGGPVNNEDKKYIDSGDNPIFDMIRQLQQQSNQQVSLPTTTPTTTTTTPTTTEAVKNFEEAKNLLNLFTSSSVVPTSQESKTENLEEMNFEERVDSLLDAINKHAQSKVKTKEIAKEYNTLVSALNDAITIIENKPLTTVSYKRNLLSTAYIKSIESISTFITKNKVGSIEKNAVALINDWLSILNNPEFYSDGRTYNLVNGKVVKYDKPKQEEGPLPFRLNIKTIEDFEAKVEEYKATNPEIQLIENIEYGKEINKIISAINTASNTKLLDTPIDENSDKYQELIEFASTFPNKDISETYAKTIKVDGKSKYFKKDNKTQFKLQNIKTNEIYNAFDHDYESFGKPQEFSICGIDNPYAKKLYKVEHPNIQITDFIVENILSGGIGSQFCFDCIDIDNRNIIEMKKYIGVNYFKMYNLQIEFKKAYINHLKKEIDKYIILYVKTPKSNTSKRDTYFQIIMEYRKVLTDKNEFDKDFYRNIHYYGIGIAMNKFDKIVIPSNYIYDDKFNTEEMMTHVKDSQGQKFIPHFKDRKLTHVTRTPTKDVEKDKKFNKDFNELIDGESTPYNFYVTCQFSKVLGVYDYTNDKLVENDFILNVYRCAYQHDSRDNKDFNSVLIPIEKFIVFLLDKINKNKKT